MARAYGKFSDLITFTRASGGTALRPIGYGSELVTNGTFDSGLSGWTDSSEGTGSIEWNASGYLDLTTGVDTTNEGRAYQIVSTEVGKVYRLMVTRSGGNSRVDLSGTSPTAAEIWFSSVSSSNEDKLFVATSTTTYINFRNLTNFNSTSSIDFVTVREVLFDQPNAPLTLLNHPVNVPRIEYDADGNRLGLLVEESRTNLVTYSDDFSGWLKTSGGAVTPNQAAAPDGTVTADEFVGVLYKTQNLSTGTRCFSVYLKANAGTTAAIRVDTPADNRIKVDLTDGSVISTTGASIDSYGVTYVGNGWYRCHIVITDALINYVVLAESNVANHTVYIWGAQLEVGSFPTSYIPTSGSTATRAADVASIPVSEFGYNGDEGTVFIEANAPIDSNQTRLTQLVTLGSSDNRVIDLHRADNDIATYNGSVTIVGHPFNASNDIKAAAVYKSGSYALVSDGQTAATASTQAVLNPNTLTLGMNGASARHLNGHIKSIKYYPRRLTNSQLVEITS